MLRIYIEVSTSGLSDASFSPLTDYDDTGGSTTFDHSPATPGQLYIYRARRYDTSSGLYSAWAYAYARAIYQLRNPSTMLDALEVWTGSDERLGVIIEAFEGIPTKVAWLAELSSGEINRDLQRGYSNTKRKGLTMRKKVVKNSFRYAGSYVLEITPEAAFPRMLMATMYYEGATSLTTPTRYVHRWSNKEGVKTLTMIHQKGTVYKIYPGCKVNSLAISPELGTDGVAMATFGIEALDEIVMPAWTVTSVDTLTGMSTSAADPLQPYSPEDFVAIFAGVDGHDIRSYQFNYAKPLGAYQGYGGTHGAKGHVERSGDPTLQTSAVFSRSALLAVLRDMGYNAEPAGAFSSLDQVYTVPFNFVASPPNNAAGFANTLGIYVEQADVKITSETASGRDEIILSMDVMPLDLIGNSSGTDCYIELTNGITQAQMSAAGTAFAPTDIPVGRSFRYEFGVTQASATTTVISAGAANPHLSVTDNIYNGRRIRFVTGTLTGQDRFVTAYTGSTKTFTVGTAFSSSPATNDLFVVL